MAAAWMALRLGEGLQAGPGMLLPVTIGSHRDVIGTMACLVFFVPLCQLFGGKSPPLNFARFPAWLCAMAAALFALAASHCVDDIIAVEPNPIAASGNWCFKMLCGLTGWALSPSKAPPLACIFMVIGVVLDLSGVPLAEAILKIETKHIEHRTTQQAHNADRRYRSARLW